MGRNFHYLFIAATTKPAGLLIVVLNLRCHYADASSRACNSVLQVCGGDCEVLEAGLNLFDLVLLETDQLKRVLLDRMKQFVEMKQFDIVNSCLLHLGDVERSDAGDLESGPGEPNNSRHMEVFAEEVDCFNWYIKFRCVNL